jgi:uncharacterized protein YjdB
MPDIIVSSKNPSSIVTPAAGTVELFRDSTNNNHLSYMDSDRDIVDLEARATSSTSTTATECCSCEIVENYWKQVMCAVNKGLIDATQLQALISLGFNSTNVETDDGEGNTSCSVNSGPRNINVTSLSIDGAGTRNMAPAATLQLTATLLPANASNLGVTWESNDLAVATVNATGLVTSIVPGFVVIKAISISDPSIFDTVEITVA